MQESVSTLKFAQRVKKVTLNAERNEIVGEKALLIRYEQTVSVLSYNRPDLDPIDVTIAVDCGNDCVHRSIGECSRWSTSNTQTWRHD